MGFNWNPFYFLLLIWDATLIFFFQEIPVESGQMVFLEEWFQGAILSCYQDVLETIAYQFSHLTSFGLSQNLNLLSISHHSF